MLYKIYSFGLIGLTLITLLLSACATGPKNIDRRVGSADKSLTLTPQDIDGIIVVGLHQQSRFFGAGHRDVHTMEFRSFDPVTRRLIPESNGGRIIRLSRGGDFFNKDISAKKNSIRYLVQRLPAGFYYLTTVFWGGHTEVR